MARLFKGPQDRPGVCDRAECPGRPQGFPCLLLPGTRRVRYLVYGGHMEIAERDIGSADGLGLADAIGLLRDELLQAQAAGAGSDIQLPVESMTVELKVTATRSVDGKAGFKVPIVELELGGGAGRERGSEQAVTVVFAGPVDREGRPVKVMQGSAQPKG